MTGATITETPDTAAAVAWLRDLLEQLGPQADEVLSAVLAERDTSALRVVGPLTEEGERFGLTGLLGTVEQHPGPSQGWAWEVEGATLRNALIERGYEWWGVPPTREAADRALCTALRGLGRAPSGELVGPVSPHGAEVREAAAPFEEAARRVMSYMGRTEQGDVQRARPWQRLLVEDIRNRIGLDWRVTLVLQEIPGNPAHVIEASHSMGCFALAVPDSVLQREGRDNVEWVCSVLAVAVRRGSAQGVDWPQWVRECDMRYSFTDRQGGMFP